MPSPTKRGRNRARLVTALTAVLGLGLAGCAGLPSRGKLTTDAHPSNQSNNNVGMTSQPPQMKWTSDVFVRNFLQATCGDDKDPTYSTAAKYLTLEAADKWKPSQEKTVVLSDLQITQGPIQTAQDKKSSAVDVTVSGYPVADLDNKGFSGWQSSSARLSFPLHLVGGGDAGGEGQNWRISEPPAQRLVLLNDLRRAIPSPLPVYIPLTSGLTGPPAHPEQVYLTPSSNVLDTYTTLVDAVLSGGPTGRIGWNGTPTGAVQDPARHVTVDATSNSPAVTATVNLSVGPSKPDMLDPLARAIFRTLQSVPTAPQYANVQKITRLRLIVAGQLAADRTDPTGLDPTLPSTPRVYMLSHGKITYFDDVAGAKTVDSLASPPINWLGKTQNIDQFAVKTVSSELTDTGTGRPSAQNVGPWYAVSVAGQGQKRGEVFVGDDSNAQPVLAYTAKGKVTSLSWDPVDGSLWVVDDNTLVHVSDGGGVYTPANVKINQSTVPSATAPITGTLQTFRFSPDGQQAVLITAPVGNDPNQTSHAWLATINPGPGTARLVVTPQFELQPEGAGQGNGFVQAYDAGWAGGRTIVLLAKDAQSTLPKIYQIYADGSQDSDLAAVQDDTGPIIGSQLATMGTNGGKVLTKTFVSGLGVEDKKQVSKIYRTHPPTPAEDDDASLPTIAANVYAKAVG